MGKTIDINTPPPVGDSGKPIEPGSPGEAVAHSTAYVIEDLNDDGFGYGDDLTSKTKETLGSYLNSIQSPGNAFKVTNVNSTTTSEFNVKSDSTPSIVYGGQANSTDSFKNHVDGVEVNQSNIDMISTMFDEILPVTGEDPEINLSDFLDKTVRSISKHTLLSNVKATGGYHGNQYEVGGSRFGQKDEFTPPGGNEASQVMQRKIAAVLNTNRFSPGGDTPFIRGGTTGGVVSHVQGELGVYKQNTPEITFDQLAEIGMALMVRGTGHEYADDATTARPGLNTLNVKNTVQALLAPSGPQLQVTRVDTRKITTTRIMNDLGIYGPPAEGNAKFEIPDSSYTQEERGDGDGVFGAQGASANDQSYGSLNSPLEMFDGPAPLGMVILAATSLVSIIVLSFVINEIVNQASAAKGKDQTPEDRGINQKPKRFGLGDPAQTYKGVGGSYRPTNSNGGDLVMRMLRIPFLKNRFDTCFVYGIQAFYGFAENSFSDMASGNYAAPDMDFIIQAAENLLLSSGYYASIMRNVVRDLEQIVHQGEDLANAKGLSDGIQGVFGILEKMATSATFRFIMTMATIGDAVLCSKFKLLSPTRIDLNSIKTAPGTRHLKNREGIFDSRWALRASSAPSLYLLPGSFVSALNMVQDGTSGKVNPLLGHASILSLGNHGTWKEYKGNGAYISTGGQNESDKNNQLIASRNTSMIDPNLVKEMEDYLDAEYFPFYFHDMRTNEIISFHAFLSNLAESFSPSWNSSGGIGRIDEVHTYEKTSRTFDISFVVASTREDDFDHMWWKINKLTAMVYPQWSKGKQMEGPMGRRFRMPFSQIPTASPLIRLRVGDVAKSNYSRFNIARLFGAGDPELESSFRKVAGAVALTPAEIGTRDFHYNKKVTELFVACSKRFKNDVGKNWFFENGILQPGDIIDFSTMGPAYENTVLAAHLDDDGAMTLIYPRESKLVMEVKEIVPGAYGTKGTYDKFTNNDDPHNVQKNQKTNVLDSRDGVKLQFRSSLNGGRKIVTDYGLEIKDGMVFDPIDSYELWCAFSSQITQSNMKYIYEPEAKKFANEKIAKLKSESPKAMAGVREFFGEKNAIVRSFEASRGRGIAGVITSLSFDYAASTFETERPGSRAPKFMTVSLSFTAIHDIAPGLDASGMLRAPTHNVGRAMLGAFGDVYDDNLEKAVGIQQENLAQGVVQEKPPKPQSNKDQGGQNPGGTTPLKTGATGP